MGAVSFSLSPKSKGAQKIYRTVLQPFPAGSRGARGVLLKWVLYFCSPSARDAKERKRAQHINRTALEQHAAGSRSSSSASSPASALRSTRLGCCTLCLFKAPARCRSSPDPPSSLRRRAPLSCREKANGADRNGLGILLGKFPVKSANTKNRHAQTNTTMCAEATLIRGNHICANYIFPRTIRNDS